MSSKRDKPAKCLNCGVEFMAFRHSAARYCSVNCRNGHWQNHHPAKAATDEKRIVELYKSGLGCRLVGRAIGVDYQIVRRIVKTAGVSDPSRKSPVTVKGCAQVVSEATRSAREKARISRLILREYKVESRAAARADNMWGKSQSGHPEYTKWYVRAKDKRHRVARTNYFLAKILRTRVNRVLQGSLKSAPTLTLLGCSLDQLKTHLQSKFKKGMNWGNYGSYWNIDHREPCSSFDLSKPEQQRVCFHFSNLQPLRASENLIKSDSLPRQLQRELLLSL